MHLLTRISLALATSAALVTHALAADAIVSTLEPAPLGLPVIGKVKARHAREITSSWWSVGGETLDRDFTDYQRYKQYLGPLGAKGIRVQTGWAKCEPKPGVYSWAWLDAVVDDAVAQGVRPWLEFNYGNPIYEGGGDISLGGGFPTSPTALAAWYKWVRALVTRYGDRVHEWEVWNEPDLDKTGISPVTQYLELFLRTATITREVQPRARIWALGLANTFTYAEEFLAGLQARGKLGLLDAITIHGYPKNPDDTTNVDRVRALLAKYGAKIEVRQGETGAPSKLQPNYALSKLSWTETTQAKWDLRRMLAHRAKDVPFNLFTMSDMHYIVGRTASSGTMSMNYKGLLATNPDKSIAYAKPIYFAAQSVFSIFDDSVTRIAEYPSTSTAIRALAVTGYRSETKGGGQLVAVWFNDAPPDDGHPVSRANLTLAAGKFTDPVLVDLRTSTVYAIAKDTWSQTKDGATFRDLPIYDSPVLIAERATLGITAAP